MELSARLNAVAHMVTKGNRVCDAGCDHGYVSIYLILEEICPKVIAMDVRTGPLKRAKEHICEYGLSEYIETRLSDGVEGLQQGEVDSLILAGMGGKLMQGILERGREKVVRMKELVLQPQSELYEFRKFLRKQGFMIQMETMILEDGKFYPIMKVVPKELFLKSDVESFAFEGLKKEDAQRLSDKFGPFLLQNKNSVLIEYLLFLQKQYQTIYQQIEQKQELSIKSQERAHEIQLELEDISMALDLMAYK